MAFETNYIRLAQFQNCNGSRNDIIKEILRDNAINYQIPLNPSLKQIKLDLEGCTALHIAVKVDDFEAFVRLIRYYADFTIKNGKSETVIHAAINMPMKNAKTLLELNRNIDNKFITAALSAHVTFNNSTNPCDENGISHFHIACITGNIAAIVFFIKNGVSVSEAIHWDSPTLPGFTPLHCAARYSRVSSARILLEHGAAGDCKDSQGLTPFHLFIEKGMKIIDLINMGKRIDCAIGMLNSNLQAYDNIIKLMLKQYLDILVLQKHYHIDNRYMIDKTELSCLHVACTLQNILFVEQLLEKNADLEQSIGADSPLWPGYTALHFAAHFNIDTVKLLIKKGANILAQDVKGVSPFDLCLQRYEAEVIEFLIVNQIDWTYIHFSDRTFLQVLIQAMKHKSLLSSFLQAMMINVNVSIPIHSPIWPGYTPLHVAVNFAGRYKEIDGIFMTLDSKNKNYNCSEEQLYLERVQLLLEAGADVTAQDLYGSTPLHHAFILQREDVVNLLLQYHKSSNINPTNNDRLSHLHIACVAGNDNLVCKLLAEAFYINLQTSFDYKYKKTYHKDAKPATFFFKAGSTPLHIAVIVRDTEIVRTLMSHGADIYARDDEGMTPVHRLLAHDFHFQVVEIGKLLLPKSHLQDCVTSLGLSHLHIASHVNNVGAIKRLLDSGADIKATVKYEKLSAINNKFPIDESEEPLSFLSLYSNYTPLDFAVRDSCIEAFNFLLYRGSRIITNPLESICCANFDSFLKKLTDLEMNKTLKNIFGRLKLHKACFSFDVDEVRELLESGADPNSRISEDSNIFPGCTPLHLLTHQANYDDNFSEIAELLINHGANVTLTNSDGISPLHTTFRSRIYGKKQFFDLLMNGYKDFGVNPTDDKGVSHFHIACMFNKVAIVENFLKKGGTDVNQPVEPFSNWFGGFTPLHFGTYFICDETVDLLLKYGANVHARNSNGDTPLHLAVNWVDRVNYNQNSILSLIRAGANMNVKNFAGEIPFEKILSGNNTTVTNKILEMLPECRSFVNIFNARNELGYIAASIKNEYKIKNIINNPLYASVMKAPSINSSDEMNRTPIHNIVAIRKLKTPVKIYIKAILVFIQLGINIDQQNTNGETALYYAVKFQNSKAVVALLALGADVNITNNHRRTPFSCSWYHSCRVEKLHSSTTVAMRILKELWNHVFKLQTADMFVNQINKHLENKTLDRLAPDNKYSEFITERIKQFTEELERFENKKVDSCEVILISFLVETGVINSYPHMLLKNRQAIDNLFRNRHFYLRREFPVYSSILQLQYKKAVQRVELLESAKDAFDFLTKFKLPILCCHQVLKFLTNNDLITLIALDEEIMSPLPKRRKLN